MNAKPKKSTLLLAAGGLMLNRSLLAARLHRRVDGWRRAAGLMLRDECSTFVLSAFGLEVWSDAAGGSRRSVEETRAHAGARLAGFLSAERGCHLAVERGEEEDRARPLSGPSYTLGFEPWVEGPGRFVPPGEWRGERVGPADAGVLMDIVLRVGDAGRADVWARVNHVAVDGVPVQEMLSRLEAAWGGAGDVVFPHGEEFDRVMIPRAVPGRPELCEVQAFVDFAPLLAWRKRENARLAEPMTVSAAMLWCLARTVGDHPIGTTVEVAAGGGLERGVGVVVVRPRRYGADGLARYVREFNRDLELTRRRVSEPCKTLDAAALLPARRAEALLRHALENQPRAFGSLALTMLKDARVFGAPIARFGHARGFIAVGSVGLATASGARVGCITVKGPRGLVEGYPGLIREAVEGCGR